MKKKINFYNFTCFSIDDSQIFLLENIFMNIKKDLNLNENYEIELSIISDTTMKKINNKYRNMNKTTDVLSFSFMSEDLTSVSDLIGNIFISGEEIGRIAKIDNLNEMKLLTELFIHGTLHVLNYDHGVEMSSLENKYKKLFI